MFPAVVRGGEDGDEPLVGEELVAIVDDLVRADLREGGGGKGGR